MTSALRPPRLVVETREIEHIDDLLTYASADEPLAWLRRGDGIVGIGVVGGYERGPHSAPGIDPADLPSPADTWRQLAASAEIDDPVRLPGTGLVAFGTLVFDERSSATSRLIVPQAVVGRHRGRSWVTRMRPTYATLQDPAVEPTPYGPYWSATLGPGTLNPAGYQAAVRQAVDAIMRGELEKVVLARDLVGTIPAGADLRRLVRALADDYPDTWTFAVDGLIGASPETLVTASRGVVTARVLAGTIPRGTDAHDDTAASTSLSHSGKDLDEHRYAVAERARRPCARTSAICAPTPSRSRSSCRTCGISRPMSRATSPTTRRRSTSWRRCTRPRRSRGTPRNAALDLIRRLEPFDRRRYAGPVGWVDGDGNGEWAIALRCAQIGADPALRYATYSDTIPVVAHAGAGIVAQSNPETELLETRVKFRPIVDALA